MFCKNCGVELNDDAKFCPSCGKAIVESSTVEDKKDSRDKKTLSANPDAIILKSSAPLPDKFDWIKWAYFVALLPAVISPGICIITVPIVLVIHSYLSDYHRKKIRKLRFQFVSPVTADEIYNKLEPVLAKKWGNKVEFDREGETISVKYEKIIYDINLMEDGTFCVWWRLSLARAFFSNAGYKQIRTATGVIAYELQQQFGVV
ncbi:MAG: zinc ribbon domain-containing protein [Selenomonadaceae bacterium]|nr:zinc ribbon domain-containing protein [Selenomonadaceae bacterium]